MFMKTETINIAVIGAYQESHGYPHVMWLINELIQDNRFQITKIKSPLTHKSGYSTATRNLLSLILTTVNLVIGSIYTVISLLIQHKLKSIDIVYIPYPSLIPLLIFSTLPKKIRPLLVADIFISIYDTVVRDRKLLPKYSYLSKLLYRIERRALRTANALTTDTICNKHFLQRLFLIPENNIFSLPLATDEIHYRPTPYKEQIGTFHILFIGTFVPLHGVDTVARAALLLADRDDIEFRLFGDGQAANLVENIIKNKNHNIVWKREWSSPSELYAEVANADICLGIFGDTSKAKRVLPFKNYLAFRVGRPVITQDNMCWPQSDSDDTKVPFIATPAGDHESLAESILELLNNGSRRIELSRIAQNYYTKHLANSVVTEQFYLLCKKVIND